MDIILSELKQTTVIPTNVKKLYRFRIIIPADQWHAVEAGCPIHINGTGYRIATSAWTNFTRKGLQVSVTCWQVRDE